MFMCVNKLKPFNRAQWKKCCKKKKLKWVNICVYIKKKKKYYRLENVINNI